MTKDLYQIVTDKILAQMETAGSAWLKPWNAKDGAAVDGAMPRNAVTGHEYQGVNVPMLWFAARSAGYATNGWATFNQWRDKGASVRKGEKGTEIVFFKTLEKTREDLRDSNGDPAKVKIPLLRSWHVFNADQVDGFERKEPAEPVAPLDIRIERAEVFARNTGADIRHGGDRAFYAPGRGRDFVQMPHIAAFKDGPTRTAPEAYYSVLFHELTHWTSDESRCNRQLGKRFGDHAYAAEELIAELGAAFLCAHLGITNEPREDHARYLNNWLEVLKGDKRAIFTAASKATAGANFLRAKQGEQIAAVAA